MTPLQTHLKAVERVLQSRDVALLIALTPESVSRLRGGRPARGDNEMAILTLRAVVDAGMSATGDNGAAVRDALLAHLCAPGGSELTHALRSGQADAVLQMLTFDHPAPTVDDLAADMAFDARMAAQEHASGTDAHGASDAPAVIPTRLRDQHRAVSAALLAFAPNAVLADRVLMGERPDDDQVLVRVSIPGMRHSEVLDRMREFERLHWDTLLAGIGDDICIVSR